MVQMFPINKKCSITASREKYLHSVCHHRTSSLGMPYVNFKKNIFKMLNFLTISYVLNH